MNDSEVEGSELEQPESGAPATDVAAVEAAETETQEVSSAEPEPAEGTSSEAEVLETEGATTVAPEDTVAVEVVKDEALEPKEGGKGLSIVKKILLWAAIVIAALFMLLGLAGIIGAWAINTPATETILAVLLPIDNTLQRLEVVSGEAAAALSDASMSLNDADQRVQELGAGLAETSLVREVLTRILDVDLEQKVSNAREGIRSIYDTVVAVEETVNAVNAIPFVNVEVPGSTEIAAIRTGMEEMAASAEELRQENQQRREDRAETLVNAITTPLDRLTARVDELQTRVSNAETRFAQAIERVDALQEKVPGWIDVISIIATLLYAWLMFSQAAVIVLCWRALHDQPRVAAA